MVDVMTILRYDAKDDSKCCMYTNVRVEAIQEVLENYVQSQTGSGNGKESPGFVDRDLYTVKIGLELEDDVFYTESDTGNKGLTVGIAMHFLTLLPLPAERLHTLKDWRALQATLV